MNTQQIDKIERERAKILENQQISDNLYEELLNDIGLKKHSLEEEFLFDAVYNSVKEDDFKYFLQECQNRLKD